MSAAAPGVAWRPDEATRARARITRFMEERGIPDPAELHRRSVEDPAWFTEEVLRFLDLRFDPPYDRVLDLSDGLPHARWCVGGGLNVARACLDRHRDGARADRPAIAWEGEEGVVRSLTYRELTEEVERCAAGLRGLGVGAGDAVAIHLPLVPETAVALLAAARVGAVAVPLFSGYGPAAIAERLRDVEAAVLVTCDGFPRRGREVEAKETADRALASAPSVRRVVVVRRTGRTVPMAEGRDLEWEALLAAGSRADRAARAPARTDAEHPLIVLYSSGTTGRPKGILHSHCGFPVKAAQDMAFGTDVGPGTRICWITDIGWMMGPWLLYGALLLGGTAVLYDGAPDHPDADRLWAVCERHGVEVLGISPTLVRALMVHGEEPVRRHDLSALRILGSTGEPWNPDPWWWLFRTVGGERVPIVNYSGGTEISGGILMGSPVEPQKPCAFSGPCPGIAADVVDADGRPVRGEVGELVIRGPWIGMARGFWNDPERYLDTYWSRWPDVWVHGDWARVDADGHWTILGRSDDTIMVGGKRIGPAEVESVLVGHPAVMEAAAIGVPDPVKGEALVAVCVIARGAGDGRGAAGEDGDGGGGRRGRATGDGDGGAADAGAGLAAELRERVAAELGKPLRPRDVLLVPDLPRTRSAKVMRRVVRAAYLGEEPGDVAALANPAAVEAIRSAARKASA